MTGRERVRKCLRFENPDRVPRDLWSLPYINLYRNEEFDEVVKKYPMDIEELARKYKGKVTFWGEMDRQYVMPFGSREEVGQAVGRVRKALDDGSGGVIAQCEWGKADPRENVETVFETWGECTSGTC